MLYVRWERRHSLGLSPSPKLISSILAVALERDTLHAAVAVENVLLIVHNAVDELASAGGLERGALDYGSILGRVWHLFWYEPHRRYK